MSHVSAFIPSPVYDSSYSYPQGKMHVSHPQDLHILELPMVQNETLNKFFHVNSYLWIASQLLGANLLPFCWFMLQQLSTLQPASPAEQRRNSASACAWVSFPLQLFCPRSLCGLGCRSWIWIWMTTLPSGCPDQNWRKICHMWRDTITAFCHWGVARTLPLLRTVTHLEVPCEAQQVTNHNLSQAK